MSGLDSTDVAGLLDGLFRQDSRRILATLIRLLGDFDLAEDGLHDAFAAALHSWPREGIPSNPRAWLVSTGRFKAIDRLRRQARFAPLEDLPSPPSMDLSDLEDQDGAELGDDRLRLLFTCCHPALSLEAATALTLRDICGLRTEVIARAFLVPPATLAQRIVRAKAKIRDARLPYEVPGRADLPGRLSAVLQVVYLVFNEGYASATGEALLRPDLSAEAIRLGRLLLDLMPEPEVMGLLALMLLQESRREARTTSEGELVLLEDQDRSRWDRGLIEEGRSLVSRALAIASPGVYTLQAAIAAVHTEARDLADTDWTRLLAWYDLLARIAPSPVVALNRAVALAMRDGPEAGLPQVDALLEGGGLASYHLAHAVRADLCRRLGRTAEARRAYQQALGLAQQGPERRFLERRLAALQP